MSVVGGTKMSFDPDGDPSPPASKPHASYPATTGALGHGGESSEQV